MYVPSITIFLFYHGMTRQVKLVDRVASKVTALVGPYFKNICMYSGKTP